MSPIMFAWCMSFFLIQSLGKCVNTFCSPLVRWKVENLNHVVLEDGFCDCLRMICFDHFLLNLLQLVSNFAIELSLFLDHLVLRASSDSSVEHSKIKHVMT